MAKLGMQLSGDGASHERRAALRSTSSPTAAPAVSMSTGRGSVVVRIGDDVYAIGDRCSHADVSLSEGEVDDDECHDRVPQARQWFSLETGEALSLPAVKPMPTYDVAVVDGEVVVSRCPKRRREVDS